MNTFLYDLAVESGEIEAHEGNPEELTIVTDDSESELEEVVAQLADDVEKVESQDNAAEKMIDVIESLESKIVMLRSMRDRGENLNAAAAKIYSSSLVTSLESRGFPTALFADEVIGMNTSFESSNAYDYTVEAEEKSEGILAKIKNMIKAAFKAFVEWVGRVAETTKMLGKSLNTLGVKLTKAADAKGKNLPLTEEDSKISSKGLELIGEDPEAVLEKVKQSNQKLDSITNSTLGDLKAQVMNNDGKHLSDISSIDLTVGLGRTIVGTVMTDALDAPVTFAVKTTGNSVKDEIKTLTLVQIKTLGNKIATLGTQLEASGKQSDKNIKAMDLSIKAIFAELDKADPKDTTSSKYLKPLNNTTKGVRSLRALFNKEAANVGKQAYRYGIKSLAKYK